MNTFGIYGIKDLLIVRDGYVTDCNEQTVSKFKFNDWNSLKFIATRKKVMYFINETQVGEYPTPSKINKKNEIYIYCNKNSTIHSEWPETWVDEIKMNIMWGIPEYDDEYYDYLYPED